MGLLFLEKMAKKKAKKKKTSKADKKATLRQLGKEAQEKKLGGELGRHYNDSKDHFQVMRDGWDEKEAMLICKLEDEISADDRVKSQVFDPRLSTIVFERAARVMANHPTGKAWPVSKNDIGKAKFMNLLLGYYTNNANYWRSMITKHRIMDIYSMVYGTMFALTPWMVNERTNYVGPEYVPVPIRAAHPQPGADSVRSSDWFQVSSFRTIKWLEKQNGKGGWKNIDKLKARILKSDKSESSDDRGDTKPDEQKSYIEEKWYNDKWGDSAFPKVWLVTEYRRDKWYTFAPAHGNIIVREQEDPLGLGEIPVVEKQCFPIMGSIIGLSEFETGKTLQLAINSLINLYMDGVKYSIFPPVHIDPNSVVKSSIIWSPGAKWLMKRPNVDVQHMNLSPQGLRTFQSTYGFLVSAILNQAGTSTINNPEGVDSMMGKTPQAIRYQASRENSRDEWDRVMMEEMLKDLYGKWIKMITKKQHKKVPLRLFGDEAKYMAEQYPDVVELLDPKAGYSLASVGKQEIEATYDYELDTSSTVNKGTDFEKNNLIELLGLMTKSPMIIQLMREQKKDFDVAQLVKDIAKESGSKEPDKYIKDYTPPISQQVGQLPKYENESVNQTAQAMLEMMGGGGPTPPMPRNAGNANAGV